MINNIRQQRRVDPYDFYLNSIRGFTEKMLPADYLYLSELMFEYSERLEEIKKR